MSKSDGNIVDPLQIIQQFDSDSLRYFLMKESNPHGDSNFSVKDLENLYNNDLANQLGNLVYRVMSSKWIMKEGHDGNYSASERTLLQSLEKTRGFHNF